MPNVLEEKDAIRELLAQYCFHFDNGEFEAWLDLFTSDGAFDLGTRGRFGGRENLQKFLQSLPLTNGLPMMKHCVMNTIVSVNGDRATARSYVVVVQGGEQLTVSIAGRYEDGLAKVGGAWRFTERKVYFDLMSKR
jgi:3-phenylpropionate/cinnamic acid dioxygenase small subunit